MSDNMIIDGTNAVLGRTASHVAKQLLKGESVIIVNAERMIITGNKKQITEKYLNRRRIGSKHHGPFFPKMPGLIVRRSIRGMLPKTKKGVASFRRLKVHVGVPAELAGKEMKNAALKEVKTGFITVGNLAKSLGWEGE